MLPELEKYYTNQEEPVKSCLFALRSIILDQDKRVTETQKWSIPCFCYQKKMFCFLSTDKKTNAPYILFVEGKRLKHPALVQGNRTRMKILPIDPNRDFPVNTITSLLQEALDLYRNGIIKLY